MPNFVRTPKDEVRWSNAKDAVKRSRNKDEGAFTDQDWALANHIYHQMEKAESLGKAIKDMKKTVSDDDFIEDFEQFLRKARKRMSDEGVDPYDDDQDNEFSEDAGFREFDPEDEESDAERWLDENDPERQRDEEEDEGEEYGEHDSEDSDYDEYGEDEDEEAHQREVDAPTEETKALDPVQTQTAQEAEQSGADEEVPQAQEVRESRFRQPTKEEIAEMRQYTRPWESRARDAIRLKAEAHKNPVLHHEGRLVEARNAAHKTRQEAYEAFQASPEYQNADPITQMEMDAKFHQDWHAQNPEYIRNAVKLHEEAHKKGQAARDIHAAAKDEQIRHVLSGGAQAETPMSTEEALQHAGGTKGEEGTVGSMTQDRAASFAAGNKDFISQYAKDYEKKGKKPKDLSEMALYDEGSRSDVQRVLGEHPNLKDPSKKSKVDKFFAEYHPLIAMNARRVLNKLGLDHTKGDVDLGLLHEAGMHGLFQAINDYDHDHPSKASFATHAGNKIRGLMQTALRDQDQIPQELRAAAKKFQAQKAAPATKIDIHSIVSKHPPEVADRFKRINTFRQSRVPKPPKPEGGDE